MGEEKKNILNEGGKTLIGVISAYLKGEPIPKINDYKSLYLSMFLKDFLFHYH